MPTYKFRAVSASGAERLGDLEAPDLDRAADLVRGMGLTPVRIGPGAAAHSEESFFARFRRRPQLRDLILLTRQLETMLESGLPLLTALETLHRQTTHEELARAVDRVRADVEQGSTLTEAVRRHPRCFSELYANLIHAGEEGGLLTPMLERLGVLLENEEETRQRIRSATFYPLIVVAELVLAFGVLIRFVLPKFANLFRNLNAELPLPTRILIGVSDLLEHQGLLIVGGVAAAAVGFYFWARTEAGRRRIDAWAFGVPIFGPLFQKIALARFARVLGALVAGGIPIVQALAISRGVAGNRLLEEEIDRMRDGVVAGQGLSDPIRDSRVVPPLVVKMISVGEETGSVDKVLARVARFYDRDVDYAVRNLSTALEPALLIVLGGAVLFTALAVFLPLWNLMNAFRH